MRIRDRRTRDPVARAMTALLFAVLVSAGSRAASAPPFDTCQGSGWTNDSQICPLIPGPPCTWCSPDTTCSTGGCSTYSTEPSGGGGWDEYCTCGTSSQPDPCCHAVVHDDGEGNRTVDKAGVCRPTIDNCNSGDCSEVVIAGWNPETGAWMEWQDFMCID